MEEREEQRYLEKEGKKHLMKPHTLTLLYGNIGQPWGCLQNSMWLSRNISSNCLKITEKNSFSNN